MSATSLEERIAAALTCDHSSAELAALVCETEAAIDAAAQNATLERKKALDPTASPDPQAARTAMEDAAFRVRRLKTLLPKLEERYYAKWEAEKAAQWSAECEALAAERDRLAVQVRETYCAAAAQLTDLMRCLAAFEAKLSDLHSRRPASVKIHLRSPELIARNLESFDREHPPIGKNLQLPEFVRSDRLLYPPPRRLDLSAFAPVPHDDRFSADWAATQEEHAAERQAEQDRVTTFYRDQAREREQRKKADEAAQ
jgi:hypothetical protein